MIRVDEASSNDELLRVRTRQPMLNSEVEDLVHDFRKSLESIAAEHAV